MIYNELGDPLYSDEEQKEFIDYLIANRTDWSSEEKLETINFKGRKEIYTDIWSKEMYRYFIRKERVEKLKRLSDKLSDKKNKRSGEK